MARNDLYLKDEIYGILVDSTSRQIYLEWRSMGAVLNEAKLTQDKIQQIFAAIEAGVKAGKNVGTTTQDDAPKRGILGSISQSWSNFKDQISQSKPISGFDVAFDKLQDKILNKAGGKSGTIGKMLDAYKEFGNRYPKIQSAIYYGLTIAAALSGWGLGGTAVLAALRTLNGLLQGDRFSSAAWKGVKTMVLGAAAAQLFPGAEAAEVKPDVSTYAVKSGDTLSQIAQRFGVSTGELLQANPDLTNPDVLKAGQQLTLPAETGSAVYDKGVGTAADTLGKIKSGAYADSAISRAMAAKAGLKEYINYSKIVTIWENQEALKLPQLSAVYLTQDGVDAIFAAVGKSTISEGIFDTFKNKITKDKLDLFWRKNYGEYSQKDDVDSEVVKKFLRRMGVTDNLMQDVFKQLDIPSSYATPASLPKNKINVAKANKNKAKTPSAAIKNTTPDATKTKVEVPPTEPKADEKEAPTAATPEQPAEPKVELAKDEYIELPGTNYKFKKVSQWMTDDGKVASDASEKILNQLASGVSKADLDGRDLYNMRRSVYKGAANMMPESKKIKRRI